MRALLLPPDNGGALIAMPPIFGLVELLGIDGGEGDEQAPEKISVSLTRKGRLTYRDVWVNVGLHRLAYAVGSDQPLGEERVPTYEFRGLELG